MMTDDELRKLLAEATPGPWIVDSENHGEWGENFMIVQKDNLLEDIAEMVGNVDNARLIAAAPDLAAEVLRLREALWAILAPAAFGCPAQDRIEAMRDEARAALENKQ